MLAVRHVRLRFSAQPRAARSGFLSRLLSRRAPPVDRGIDLPYPPATSHQEPAISFDPSPKVQDLQRRLSAFMDEHIYPNEARHLEEAESLGPWKVWPIVEELKPKARAQGLCNLFLPPTSGNAD